MKHKELLLMLLWILAFFIVGVWFMYWIYNTEPVKTFRYVAIWIGFLALLWMTSSRARYYSRKDAQQSEKSEKHENF